ncbi:MAG: cell wall metabolism sensor histidine kinase WalK [Clostridia bacterium]|nr:cell wall metabolism sensor histidine kinase WalK [Clostridia bacterium]
MLVKNLMWRFSRTLQWKLVSIFVSITLFLMVIVWVLLVGDVETVYYDYFKNGIKNGFEKWNLNGVEDPSLNDIKRELDGSNAMIFFSIGGDFRSYTILDKNGKIQESTDKKASGEDKNEFYKEISESENFVAAMVGKTGEKAKLIRTSNGDAFFDYAEPVGNYIIYFKYYREDWSNVVKSFNRIIQTSLFFAVIASLIIGYALSKTITVPIVNIMHRAQRLAEGDFDHSLQVKSNDEIGKLTNTFNYMAKRLKKTLIEVSSEKNKIETILNYMTDGVIAFNLRGEVIHANPASKNYVKEIKDFEEFSLKYDLGIKFEEFLFLESLSTKEKNIRIDDQYLRVYFALFTDEEKKVEGVIAVLQDITEQQKLENMRREFVANVSHELKTPLTSIKSYSETLLDGALEDPETAKKFIGVINSEADRMAMLVKDLLQLSSIDNQQTKWDMKDISIVKLVKDVVENMQIDAKNKSQTMECFAIGDIPNIKADRYKIEQVIINILSNAIKYTPEGGKITVYIGKLYSEVYIKVRDTGIGIPKNDLGRIFERFFRVDKARSREMGGTGLGLAIAKEIVEAHGGSISAESEENKGSELIVTLPYVTQS